MSDRYIIIGTTPCVRCDATERGFKKHGLPYEKVDVNDLNEEQQARFDKAKAEGATSFPVVLTPGGGSWSDFQHERIKAHARKWAERGEG